MAEQKGQIMLNNESGEIEVVNNSKKSKASMQKLPNKSKQLTSLSKDKMQARTTATATITMFKGKKPDPSRNNKDLSILTQGRR